MLTLALLSFTESPSVAELRHWSILEVIDDEGRPVQLAVGRLNNSETRVRITSPLVRIEGGQVLTTSGSIYTLVGPPASAEELDLQAARRAELLGGRQAINVTSHRDRGRSG